MLAEQKGELAVVGGHEVIPYTGIAPKQVIPSDDNLRSLHGDVLTTGRTSFAEVITLLASPFGMNTFLVKWEKGSVCIIHFADFMLSYFSFHIQTIRRRLL